MAIEIMFSGCRLLRSYSRLNRRYHADQAKVRCTTTV